MKRDYQIDNIKGLLILLVVFGHSLELVRINSGVANFMYIFIYTFHMPVFVFYAGYLSKNYKKGANMAFRKLFIPFLFFNSIWNLVQVIFTANVNIPVDSPQLFTFLNPGWALWFLLALFIWRLLLPYLLKMKHLFIVSLIVGLISRLFSEFDIFLSLSRLLVFSPYFIGGYFVSKDLLEKMRKAKMRYVLITFIVTVIFTYIFVFYTNYPTEFLWADRSFADLTLSFLPSLFLGIILYIIGFAFNLIFLKIAPYTKSRLSQIGVNSLPVYIFHTYIIGGLSFYALDFDSAILAIAFLALSSLLVTLILSSNFVTHYFSKILKTLDKLLFKPTKQG